MDLTTKVLERSHTLADWTKCITSSCSLDVTWENYCDNEYGLEMIANISQNAHAYPRLLPILAAKASSRNSWSPPTLVSTHPMLVLVRPDTPSSSHPPPSPLRPHVPPLLPRLSSL